MSVLVVEDNIEVGRFAADALTELGFAHDSNADRLQR